MKTKTFENFYQRLLPLFSPQAERVLDELEKGAFNQVSFRYTFSVEAMIKISRIIERAVVENRRVADIQVSFQAISRILPQREVYEQVMTSAHQLYLYGKYDVAPEQIDWFKNTEIVDTAGTPLERYWFVVAYGPGINMSLLAEEIPSLAGQGERYYEGFYTFEQDVAYQLSAILHQLYPEQVARAVPPEQLGEGR